MASLCFLQAAGAVQEPQHEAGQSPRQQQQSQRQEQQQQQQQTLLLQLQAAQQQQQYQYQQQHAQQQQHHQAAQLQALQAQLAREGQPPFSMGTPTEEQQMAAAAILGRLSGATGSLGATGSFGATGTDATGTGLSLGGSGTPFARQRCEARANMQRWRTLF